MTKFLQFNLLPGPIVPGERGRPARFGRRLAGQRKGRQPKAANSGGGGLNPPKRETPPDSEWERRILKGWQNRSVRQWRRSVILRSIAGLVLCVPLISFGQAPASPKGFDVYRVVIERNIFDPERQPMAAGAPPVIEQPRKAGDYIALTGVMFDNGKALAFFSGSRSDYDKVIEVNGEIAGAKVTRIAPNGIVVDRAGKKIAVAVGQTVPFDGSAPGAPPAEAGVSSAPAAANTTTPGENPPNPPPLPGNLSDVMRRMMERRQHELQ